jgi:hypothetical protein
MAVETVSTTAATNIDPALQPYISYGLSEAQRLYGMNAQPSAEVQNALGGIQQRAMQGSPLLGQAQANLASTMGGGYLSGNPFFQGAFQPAAQAAQQQFLQGVGQINSAASKAGRLGSGTAQNLQNQAMGQFAQALTGTAGQLAYQNYARERARQEAANLAAPSFAEADYGDLQKLLTVGQLRQAYPQKALTNFLSAAYGSPRGGIQTSQTPYFTNPTATALGTGLLGLQFANAAAPLVSKASNWLGGQWDSFMNPVSVDTSGYGLSEMFGGVDTGMYGGASGLSIR